MINIRVIFVKFWVVGSLLFALAGSASANLEDAYKKYLQGNYKGASQDIEQVLKNNPNAKSVYTMKEAIGLRALLEMSQNKHLKSHMKVVNAYIWQYERKQFENPRRITYYLRSYLEDDSLRHKSLPNLVGAGQYAVPQLLHHLSQAENNLDRRALAYQAMVKIGREGVLPMLAATFSNDVVLLTHIVRLLDEQRDARALPYLLRLKATQKSNTLLQEVEIALQRFPAEMQDYHWAMHFVKEANRYLREGRDVGLEAIDSNGILWTWDADEKKLVNVDMLRVEFEYRPTLPATLWPLFKSEMVLYELLNAKGVPEAITSYLRASLACTWAAQELRSKKVLKTAAFEEVEGFEEKVKAFLANRMDQMVTQQMIGPQALLEAVDMAQKKFRAPITARVLQIISQNRSHDITERTITSFIDGEQYNPLIACLSHKDELVRYWSAIAIANCRPELDNVDAAKVVELLSQTVDEIAVRTVLVVAPKSPQAAQIVSNLNAVGFKAFQAHSGFDGLNAIYEFPSKDIVLLSPHIKTDMTSLEFINKLKADYKGKNIPVGIFSSVGNRGKNRIMFKDYADQIILHGENSDALRNKMKALEGQMERVVFKDDLVKIISREGLLALNHLELEVLRQYEKIIPHLVEVVSSKHHDRIHQITAVKLLGKFGDLAPESAATLLDKFKSNVDNDFKVKILAALRTTAKENLKVLDHLASIVQDISIDDAIRSEAASFLGQEVPVTKEVNRNQYLKSFFTPNHQQGAAAGL